MLLLQLRFQSTFELLLQFSSPTASDNLNSLKVLFLRTTGKCVYERGRDRQWEGCSSSSSPSSSVTRTKTLRLSKARGGAQGCPRVKVIAKPCPRHGGGKDRKKGKRKGKKQVCCMFKIFFSGCFYKSLFFGRTRRENSATGTRTRGSKDTREEVKVFLDTCFDPP